MDVLGGILILTGVVFVLAWRFKSSEFLLFKRPTQKNILSTTLFLILGGLMILIGGYLIGITPKFSNK